MGSKTDTGHEKIASAAYLKTIRFFSGGTPCVTAIAINCGDQAYGGGGQIFIGFEDLKTAFDRDGEGTNEILTDGQKCAIWWMDFFQQNTFTRNQCKYFQVCKRQKLYSEEYDFKKGFALVIGLFK